MLYTTSRERMQCRERNITPPGATQQAFMDCVVHDTSTGRDIYIDTTCVDSLSKRAEGRAEPRRAVFADAIKGKNVTYAAAAARHSALLITFVVDSNGGFQPRDDALQEAANSLDANHNAVMRTIFGATAKPPTR